MPMSTYVQQSQVEQIQVETSAINARIDSPTNITTQAVQYHQCFGNIPKTPARQRSRTPTSKHIGDSNKAAHT